MMQGKGSKGFGFLSAGLAFLGLSFTATVGQAAPQALALVAASEPIQLACKGADCAAQFSVFCLQPERLSPRPGTNYEMAPESRITVSAITGDGREIGLAARDSLRFQTLRGHMAMRISLAPGLKRRLGLEAVFLTLDQHVTLAPEAEPGDDNPIGAGELAMVEAALRPAGNQIVDQDVVAMVAARLTMRLVNTIPVFDGDTVATTGKWRRIMAAARKSGLGPMASRYAENAYELCRYFSDRVVRGDMRGCMQGQHDKLIKTLNSKYWKAIRTGS